MSMKILHFIALAIVVFFAVYFLYDLVRTARKTGIGGRRIVIDSITLLLVFLIILALNVLLNRNWAPGKVIIRIGW